MPMSPTSRGMFAQVCAARVFEGLGGQVNRDVLLNATCFSFDVHGREDSGQIGLGVGILNVFTSVFYSLAGVHCQILDTQATSLGAPISNGCNG